MQPGEDCMWFLLKIPDDEYAVQYVGPHPDIVFPTDICGFPLYWFGLPSKMINSWRLLNVSIFLEQ